VLTGGKKSGGKGFYFEPTVLTNVTHDMSIMREESFGPIIGIMKVKNDDEAIKLMSDTEYGLTAAVYSSDKSRAVKILSKVDAGTGLLELLRQSKCGGAVVRPKAFRLRGYAISYWSQSFYEAEGVSAQRLKCRVQGAGCRVGFTKAVSS